MVEYIRKIADELYKHLSPKHLPDKDANTRQEIFNVFVEEINKLDPLKFSPNFRYEFVMARLDIRMMAANNMRQDFQFYESIYNGLILMLKNYGSLNHNTDQNKFSFIANKELREIIKRDYHELTSVLFPDGAWKSTVVMAGSILETVLMDSLNSNKTIIKKAVSSKYAKIKKLKERELKNGNWNLGSLIEVSDEIGLLPPNRKESIDQVLRCYRNFIHPSVEIRNEHSISEGEAYMALGSLKSICENFEINNS
jgi:hypothetical protein